MANNKPANDGAEREQHASLARNWLTRSSPWTNMQSSRSLMCKA